MGSSGTGNLRDYPGKRGTGNGDGGQGGRRGGDRCNDAVKAELEEVARSEYYKNHQNVPRAGTQIQIVHRKRLAVITAAGEVVGYLPTKYNYLAACLASGFKYSGTVITSNNTPIPAVSVEVSLA